MENDLFPPKVSAPPAWWSNSSLTTTATGIRPVIGTPTFAGLTSAQELVDRQAASDAAKAAAARRSSLAGLTLRTAWEDVTDVVVGIPSDLFGASGPLSLRDLLAKNDRLRGLGLLVLLLALLAVAIL